jgi:hypothetical protein
VVQSVHLDDDDGDDGGAVLLVYFVDIEELM